MTVGVVAGVEDEQGHRPAPLAGRRASSADLRCGGVVGVVQGMQAAGGCRRRASTGAVHESRSKLTCAIHCQAQPAMIGSPAEWREGWSE
jgi:hypothetical protein